MGTTSRWCTIIMILVNCLKLNDKEKGFGCCSFSFLFPVSISLTTLFTYWSVFRVHRLQYL